MKTVRNAVAFALSLVLLVLCFASCGGEAVKKLTVSVSIYGIESSGEDSIWLRDKELKMDEGTTAYDAVVALCTARSVTFTENTMGMFESFTGPDGSLKPPAQKTLDNGNVKYYHFGWKLNDAVQTSLEKSASLKDHVLVEGDSITIFVQVDEITPSAS